MQEYTAVEALHSLTSRGRYDLIILDTPPSRNALSFLDAPIRLGKFLDGRIFKLFLPSEDSLLRTAARKVTKLVLTRALGEESYADLTTFLASFSAIFRVLGGNAKEMRERLRQSDATFLMVTSSAQAAIHDALHFRRRLDRLQLRCGGFVLNRTQLPDRECPLPEPSMFPPGADEATRAGLEKLAGLGRHEQELADREAAIHATLVRTAGPDIPAVMLPEILGGIDDMRSLRHLVERMQGKKSIPASGPEVP